MDEIKAQKAAIEELSQHIKSLERLFLNTIFEFEKMHGVTVTDVDLIRNRTMENHRGNLVTVQLDVRI